MLDLYKTKRKREPIVIKEGREICDRGTTEGRMAYRGRTEDMAVRQEYTCAICTKWMSRGDTTFDHQSGRGMGGSLRNDAIVDENGNWINAAVHLSCNTTKGSRKYHWKEGKYVPQ